MRTVYRIHVGARLRESHPRVYRKPKTWYNVVT